MRRVRSTRHIVDKERLVGTHRVDAPHVFDSVIGHRRGQVPTRMANIGINLGSVAEQVWLPLIGITADESVEIVEAHTTRPLIKRSGLAGSEGRSVVVLAKPRRRVTVLFQDPPNRY